MSPQPQHDSIFSQRDWPAKPSRKIGRPCFVSTPHQKQILERVLLNWTWLIRFYVEWQSLSPTPPPKRSRARALHGVCWPLRIRLSWRPQRRCRIHLQRWRFCVLKKRPWWRWHGWRWKDGDAIYADSYFPLLESEARGGMNWKKWWDQM